jgi:hypothetical protein
MAARYAAFTSVAGIGGLGFNPRISHASFGVAVLRFKIAPQVAGKEGFFPGFFGLGGATVFINAIFDYGHVHPAL